MAAENRTAAMAGLFALLLLALLIVAALLLREAASPCCGHADCRAPGHLPAMVRRSGATQF